MVCHHPSCPPRCLAHPPAEHGQVLFKRKPVQFLQPPHAENDQEVCILPVHDAPRLYVHTHTRAPEQIWHIPQTGEVFVTYEDYLTRYGPIPYAVMSTLELIIFPGWISTSRYVAPRVAPFLDCPRLTTPPQKRFICQITGHSGLNFFEALESEVSLPF